MRRLVAFVLPLSLFASATPAYAQSGDVASSSSGQLMVILAAVASAIAVFLLIIILFGKGRTSAATVQQRLGSVGSDANSSGGFFSRFAFLRKAARSAESAAEKRGATNMIATALEQANIPM
jgi:hypothetical protein